MDNRRLTYASQVLCKAVLVLEVLLVGMILFKQVWRFLGTLIGARNLRILNIF